MKCDTFTDGNDSNVIGSIGSELCRQLATFGIKRLVLYDNADLSDFGYTCRGKISYLCLAKR